MSTWSFIYLCIIDVFNVIMNRFIDQCKWRSVGGSFFHMTVLTWWLQEMFLTCWKSFKKKMKQEKKNLFMNFCRYELINCNFLYADKFVLLLWSCDVIRSVSIHQCVNRAWWELAQWSGWKKRAVSHSSLQPPRGLRGAHLSASLSVRTYERDSDDSSASFFIFLMIVSQVQDVQSSRRQSTEILCEAKTSRARCPVSHVRPKLSEKRWNRSEDAGFTWGWTVNNSKRDRCAVSQSIDPWARNMKLMLTFHKLQFL